MPDTPFLKKSNLHILIADDDQDDIGFFRETLQDITPDIRISVVSNGVELMNFLHKIVPNIIFLDINMPCKTGIECLSEIRGMNTLENVPMIIYSTAHNLKQLDKTYELGANLYFEKPASYMGMKEGLIKILSHSTNTFSQVPRDLYLIRA